MKNSLVRAGAATLAVVALWAGPSTVLRPALAATTMTATANVNIRSGPGMDQPVIGLLAVGRSIEALGASVNGWTPVSFNGRTAYIATAYLRQDTTATAPSTSGSTRQTTDYLNVRSGPGTWFSILRVLTPRTSVELTGEEQGGFAKLVGGGWVSTAYLTAAPATSAPAPAPAPAPSNPTWLRTTTSLNFRTAPTLDAAIIRVLPAGTTVQATGRESNGFGEITVGGTTGWAYLTYLTEATSSTVTLPGLTASAQAALAGVQSQFPQLSTFYGVRWDGTGADHTDGRAVDFMIPDYWNNQALGDAVAQYLVNNASRYNVKYVIWKQRIWLAAVPERGWAWMADRGSDTQNHYDHVHLSVNS